MDLSLITPLILTYNEAPNLERTLGRLEWAREVLIVDSFSSDGTLAIANRFHHARLLQREFDSFACQCNFGLRHIRTRWVLSLDADYVVSEHLIAELGHLRPHVDVSGYRARFRYCIHGHPLRASLYPPRTVLYRRDNATYFDDGHCHRVCVPGRVETLRGFIDHDDRKPLGRWLNEQSRYAIAEAHYLAGTPRTSRRWHHRLRRALVITPALVCLYTLFGKGLILDGWPGLYYCLQRTLFEALLSLELLDARLRPRGDSAASKQSLADSTAPKQTDRRDPEQIR